MQHFKPMFNPKTPSSPQSRPSWRFWGLRREERGRAEAKEGGAVCSPWRLPLWQQHRERLEEAFPSVISCHFLCWYPPVLQDWHPLQPAVMDGWGPQQALLLGVSILSSNGGLSLDLIASSGWPPAGSFMPPCMDPRAFLSHLVITKPGFPMQAKASTQACSWVESHLHLTQRPWISGNRLVSSATGYTATPALTNALRNPLAPGQRGESCSSADIQ